MGDIVRKMGIERTERRNEPPSEDLERQFQNSETIELYGGKLELVDIKPEKEKTAVPVVVAPGWAANAEVFKDNILTMAQRGRRTLALNNYHGIPTESVKDIPNAELRKAAALIAMIDEKQLEQVDVVGHSEAGLYVTLAAAARPEKFRNVVLVNPAGMIGKDGPTRLAARFSLDIAKQAINSITDGALRKPILRATKHSGRAALQNPLQGTKQVFALSNMQIPETLREIQQRGVNVAVVHTINDSAFPLQRVRESAKSGLIKEFYTRPGTHNQIYLQPGYFTRLADRALDRMAETTS